MRRSPVGPSPQPPAPVDGAGSAQLADNRRRRLPAQGDALTDDIGQGVVEWCEDDGLQFTRIPDRGRCAEGIPCDGEDRGQGRVVGLLGLPAHALGCRGEGETGDDLGEELLSIASHRGDRSGGHLGGSGDGPAGDRRNPFVLEEPGCGLQDAIAGVAHVGESSPVA